MIRKIIHYPQYHCPVHIALQLNLEANTARKLFHLSSGAPHADRWCKFLRSSTHAL